MADKVGCAVLLKNLKKLTVMTDTTISNAVAQFRCEAAVHGQFAGYCDHNSLSEATLFTHPGAADLVRPDNAHAFKI